MSSFVFAKFRKRRYAVAAAAVLLVAAFAAVRARAPSREEAVLGTFETAAGILAKAGPEEGVLLAASKEREMEAMLEPEVEFGFSEAGRRDRGPRADAARRIFLLRAGLATLSVRFADLEVSFGPDGAATVRGAAEALFRGRHGGDRREIRRIEAVLGEDGGKWRFRSVSVLPVLRR